MSTYNNTKTSPELSNIVVALYQEQQNLRQVAKLTSLSRPTVKRILLDANVPIKTQPYRGSRIIYTCNHNSFANIASQDQAYWLGFIAADGYVSRASGIPRILGLKLAEKDLGHIYLFRNFLKSDHPVKYEVNNKAYRLHISSGPLVSDLAYYGIIPNKTSTLLWPRDLSNELLRHFLRGYSDGDGCFCKTRPPRWSLVGNFEFLGRCQDFLSSELGLTYTKISQASTNSFVFSYGGRKQVRKLRDFLYKDASVYLLRKRNIADMI